MHDQPLHDQSAHQSMPLSRSTSQATSDSSEAHGPTATPAQLPQTELDVPKSRAFIPMGIVVGLAALVLATGSATAWLTWHSIQTTRSASTSQPNNPTEVVPPDGGVANPGQTTPSDPAPVVAEERVQIYWLKDVGNHFELMPTTVTVTVADQPDAILTAAFDELFDGPATEAAASTIPDNTRLRKVETRSDGIHIDLSQEFTSGGGSASMSGRLAQVIYTATTLDPDAPVWISVEGQPLDTLGGEGLMIDQPMTRHEFDENFPL